MRINCALIPSLIVKNELENDPWGTLKVVAEIGYRGIEFGPSLIDAAGSTSALKKRLDDLGLQTFSYGTGLDAIKNDLDTVIEHATALDCRYVVMFWAPCESRESVLELAQTLDRAGEKLSKHGLTLCYHNHDHEFTTFDGEAGIDILLGNTRPEYVQAEVDIAWVLFGGTDPAAHLRAYSGRCPLIHVKDIYSVEERGAWTEVGTGLVDLPAAVEAAIEGGAQWFIVEQDQPRDLAGLDSIRVSYQNLKRAIESLGHSV